MSPLTCAPSRSKCRSGGRGSCPKFSDPIGSIGLRGGGEGGSTGTTTKKTMTTPSPPGGRGAGEATGVSLKSPSSSQSRTRSSASSTRSKRLDPDLVFTRDGDSFLLPYLVARAAVNGVADRLSIDRDGSVLELPAEEGHVLLQLRQDPVQALSDEAPREGPPRRVELLRLQGERASTASTR